MNDVRPDARPYAPDASLPGDESVLFEPVTRLDGSPVPPPRWRGALGQPGAIALASAVALLCCFSLPWFSFRFGFEIVSGPGPRQQAPDLSGWSIATGLPLTPDGSVRLAMFVHLWLIPLVAGALIVLAVWWFRHRLAAGLTSAITIALLTLALLVTAGYVAQVTSLGAIGMSGTQPVYVTAWGCWLALGVNVAALAAAGRALWLTRRGV